MCVCVCVTPPNPPRSDLCPSVPQCCAWAARPTLWRRRREPSTCPTWCCASASPSATSTGPCTSPATTSCGRGRWGWRPAWTRRSGGRDPSGEGWGALGRPAEPHGTAGAGRELWSCPWPSPLQQPPCGGATCKWVWISAEETPTPPWALLCGAAALTAPFFLVSVWNTSVLQTSMALLGSPSAIPPPGQRPRGSQPVPTRQCSTSSTPSMGPSKQLPACPELGSPALGAVLQFCPPQGRAEQRSTSRPCWAHTEQRPSGNCSPFGPPGRTAGLRSTVGEPEQRCPSGPPGHAAGLKSTTGQQLANRDTVGLPGHRATLLACGQYLVNCW